MPAERIERYLPDMALLIGQTDMPKERLARAKNLRAIINVETNFLQNVDYETCFQRGVHVLAPSSAFARPVAEMTLGMAIDLCRGITAADRAFRRGSEKWLLDGAEGCFSLYGAAIGLIGFGDLARAFAPLTIPFRCPVKAYDPWVSDHVMEGFGVSAAALDEVLSTSRVIVVFAGVTSENQGFLGRREFELIAPGSVVLLMSRAAIVDFPEFLAQIEAGRFCAGGRSCAQGRGSAAVRPSRWSARRFFVRDRASDGRGRRAGPARPAAALVPPRTARNGRTLAKQAGRIMMRALRNAAARRRSGLAKPFGLDGRLVIPAAAELDGGRRLKLIIHCRPTVPAGAAQARGLGGKLINLRRIRG
jgi:hypothetical protein